MSGKPNPGELATKADIAALFDRAVTHVLGATHRAPPPHDTEAERLLVAAARWGYVADVDPALFWSDARGALFGAVRELRAGGVDRITDDAIVRFLEVVGWAPLRVRDELDACRVEPRAVRLEELAWRVTSCARRRRALDLVLRAEEHLRGDGDSEAIVDLLARAADEVSG